MHLVMCRDQQHRTPKSRKVIMAATKGVNHWNLLNSAKGRKLVHTIRNLQPIRGFSAL